MKTNKIIKSIILSIASLAVGFIAISLPFNLFGTLTKDAMHLVFICEIIIYFSLAMIFLVAAEKKKQREIKNAKRHEMRSRKIEQVRREWIDIAA